MRPAKSISRTDLLWLLRLPVMTSVAWCTPPATWSSYAAGRATRQIRRDPERGALLAEKIARTLGTRRLASSPDQIASDRTAQATVIALQILRHYRPGRWQPAISVTGREHIDAGLADGAGVVLWVADFSDYRVILKQALHRLGYAVSHLSGPRHGLSQSRFGMRFLNPIQTRIEASFLRERVVMSDKALPTERRVFGAMRVLRRRLKENGVVSITALASDWGPEVRPLFDGKVRLPAGPPGLAFETGAPLLPVFAFRTAADAYEVVIEPPLSLHHAANRAEAVAAAADGYRDLLEAYVARYPGQWAGWPYVIAPETGARGS